MNFLHKKSLGQNFISDKNLLKAIVADASISRCDNVLEIGTGTGTLTEFIAVAAKNVLSLEIDKNLGDLITERLNSYNNVKVVFKDVLSTDDNFYETFFNGEPFKVVANLPYYITTPIIFKFLTTKCSIKSMTLMMQKEVAERLVANAGDSNYSAVTIKVKSLARVKIARIVKREVFYPVPNVDSAVVTFEIKDYLNIEDRSKFNNFINVAFKTRRKTLYNNLKRYYKIDQDTFTKAIKDFGHSPSVRPQEIDIATYVTLYNLWGLKKDLILH